MLPVNMEILMDITSPPSHLLLMHSWQRRTLALMWHGVQQDLRVHIRLAQSIAFVAWQSHRPSRFMDDPSDLNQDVARAKEDTQGVALDMHTFGTAARRLAALDRQTVFIVIGLCLGLILGAELLRWLALGTYSLAVIPILVGGIGAEIGRSLMRPEEKRLGGLHSEIDRLLYEITNLPKNTPTAVVKSKWNDYQQLSERHRELVLKLASARSTHPKQLTGKGRRKQNTSAPQLLGIVE
jgi:hypothetical protein